MAGGLSILSRFEPGDRVRVRKGSSPGHVRTPAYVQGKVGVVRAIHGRFRNPESLAYDGDGLPKQTLYLVRFSMDHVWGDEDLAGNRVHVDLYEHWLEPTQEADG
ncbi:MAG: SH3-like domain-containing protein [Thermoplasmata archaeon]